MTELVGYARVSTREERQVFDRQVDALKAAGCERVFEDRRQMTPVAPDPDAQALAGELIDHVQHAQLAPVPGPVLDEVVGPDVVGPFGPQPHAGPVVQP